MMGVPYKTQTKSRITVQKLHQKQVQSRVMDSPNVLPSQTLRKVIFILIPRQLLTPVTRNVYRWGTRRVHEQNYCTQKIKPRS